jgi:hypothetical protein
MSDDLYDGRGIHHLTSSSNQRRSDVDDKNGFDFRGRSSSGKMMANFATKDGRHDNRHSKSIFFVLRDCVHGTLSCMDQGSKMIILESILTTFEAEKKLKKAEKQHPMFPSRSFIFSATRPVAKIGSNLVCLNR